MKRKYRWGIIGLGDIAHQFANSFKSESGEIAAVSARNLERIKAFAAKYQIPTFYATPDELLNDPSIDIVYIAVPNNTHFEYIMAALEAGKHVLCEKAITMNQKELEEASILANKNGLILQEAMTIFNMPLFWKLKEIADRGLLGKLKMIQAPFGSYKEPDPNNRFFNPNLAGGALLDIGTYAVSFARFFLSSTPHVVASQMVPFSTGVDEQSITILKTKENELATISLTFQAKMPKIGIVAFEKGYISVPEYPRADEATITYLDGTIENIHAGDSAQAINYEIATMIQAIESGENKTLSLTTDVIQILDDMQAHWHA